ncbi:GNAT family N-acetyltransferase [Gordonia polyisoprenivorans]|uniref:GNAT family N-acetyltransferase n=1 Tax=Gordonia polyisoprenivorans TaxID=84595 RepID=UPI002301DB1D|nr:GNAT family protein [Gordonia polyisoprenivorans]WCB39483.1 GNAT family protein [Gordonia polyisoprenivorans]
MLRDFSEADLSLVQSVASDPLIPLITTIPASGSHDDGLAFIYRQRGRVATGEGYSFAIADHGTGEAVGQIGLWLPDIKDGRADIGYWIAARYRRRGYLTRALECLTSWAIDLDDIHRLQMKVEPGNEGSWRAAQRCGFQREGLLRSWQTIGDSRKDLYMYSVVATRR